MDVWKKNLFKGVAALIVGTSCCWLSALAVWLGGATLLGLIAIQIERIQIPLVVIGTILILVALNSYFKKTNEN